MKNTRCPRCGGSIYIGHDDILYLSKREADIIEEAKIKDQFKLNLEVAPEVEHSEGPESEDEMGHQSNK